MKLKKLVMLVVILALVLAVSAPALADVLVQAPTQIYVSGSNTNIAGAVVTGP